MMEILRCDSGARNGRHGGCSKPFRSFRLCANVWAIPQEEEPYMAEYVLIESRDPFESNDVGYYYDLARGLVETGNQVTLFLAQNGVLAARPASLSALGLSALARS